MPAVEQVKVLSAPESGCAPATTTERFPALPCSRRKAAAGLTGHGSGVRGQARISILLKNLPFILREPQDERRSV